MGKVNLSRVILGGVLAGVIINFSEFLLNEKVMKAHAEEMMRALGKAMPQGASVMTVWILWGFAAGIAAVWLYAAIRPRYGAGASTAIRAGVAVWFFAWLLSMVAMQNMGVFPLSPLALAWTLVECLVATVAGAWVYRENGIS
jgi:hypothetical protein